jgi:endoglucanase
MTRIPLLLLLGLLAGTAAWAQPKVRLNQVGFYPEAPKVAAAIGAASGDFDVVEAASGTVVFSAPLPSPVVWAPSGEVVRLADFSALAEPGTYRLRLADGTESPPFRIASHVHQALAEAALRGFYFQRASTALLPEHAGPWARPAGHPDLQVRVHASAATARRPTHTLIPAPKGWYDAGDYNKYVVNSGISTYTVLSIYEHFPGYAARQHLNIPESGGPVPDVLAEALWNLEWMLAMQDPHDGGVYHKLTNPNFDGYVMPDRATTLRYVVQKSTAATLNFAAVMAQASRVFRPYDPALADSMGAAAVHAWAWARANPAVYYDQAAMNRLYAPAIHTGEYGDSDVSDEFAWAATELYVTTGDAGFLQGVPDFVAGSGNAPLPWWGGVRTLGFYSILHHRDRLGPEARALDVQNRVMALANTLRSRQQASPLRVAMQSGDFYWGSNSVAANQAIALVQAFRLTQDATYLHAALAHLDYLLGRNGTGYSYVTGHGTHATRDPHHRPSIADGYPDPVPGLLAGGPNPQRQDQAQCPPYPSTLPAKAYLDHYCSYASNEIAINWNAPLAYLAVALEVFMSADGLPSSTPPPRERAHRSRIESAYPNPSRGPVEVHLVLEAPGPARLAVYDLLGRLVHIAFEAGLSAGRLTVRVDTPHLPAGAYLLRLDTAGTTDTRLLQVVR